MFRYIYWTEVGSSSRVGRSRQDGSGVSYFDSSVTLISPNGLYLNEVEEAIYVVDGYTLLVLECSVEGM